MDELTIRTEQLPDTITDLAAYDRFISARQPAYRKLLRTVKEWSDASEEEKRILKRAQDEAEYLIDIRVKMGEITSRMEKASAGRPSKISNNVVTNKKENELSEIGVSKMQASRYEALAKNPEVVEQAKAKARENNELVTQTAILKEISDNKKPHVANNSGNNEWYTPVEIIEAARDAMGSIDLDPASSDKAQEVVKAGTYYTIETNGLNKKWFGNIWMNPPYATDLIGLFIKKLGDEYDNFEQAVVLVNNATETEWFNELISIASAVCFPKGRVRFYTPEGKTGAPLQGQAVVYIGSRIDKFMKAFSEIGWGAYL